MKKWMVFGLAASLLFQTGCRMESSQNHLQGAVMADSKDKIGGKSGAERAEELKIFLGRIEGITGSAVIVEGHTAIIGLRTQAQTQAEANRIMDAAEEAAKAYGTEIQNVSVTVTESIVSLIEVEEKKRMGK